MCGLGECGPDLRGGRKWGVPVCSAEEKKVSFVLANDRPATHKDGRLNLAAKLRRAQVELEVELWPASV